MLYIMQNAATTTTKHAWGQERPEDNDDGLVEHNNDTPNYAHEQEKHPLLSSLPVHTKYQPQAKQHTDATWDWHY